MKKENTQEKIAQKKKRTKIICYISLFVLVVLLFLPKALRIFAKPEEPKEDNDVEVIVLNCNKTDETISSTFADNEPQNILYQIKGNKTIEDNSDANITPDESESTTSTSVGGLDSTTDTDDDSTDSNSGTDDNSSESTSSNDNDSSNSSSSSILGEQTLFEVFQPTASISYDEENDVTSLRVDVASLKTLPAYNEIFNSVINQERYYSSLGFSCSKTTV